MTHPDRIDALMPEYKNPDDGLTHEQIAAEIAQLAEDRRGINGTIEAALDRAFQRGRKFEREQEPAAVEGNELAEAIEYYSNVPHGANSKLPILLEAARAHASQNQDIETFPIWVCNNCDVETCGPDPYATWTNDEGEEEDLCRNCHSHNEMIDTGRQSQAFEPRKEQQPINKDDLISRIAGLKRHIRANYSDGTFTPCDNPEDVGFNHGLDAALAEIKGEGR